LNRQAFPLSASSTRDRSRPAPHPHFSAQGQDEAARPEAINQPRRDLTAPKTCPSLLYLNHTSSDCPVASP
jgi:hypothetical protein